MRTRLLARVAALFALSLPLSACVGVRLQNKDGQKGFVLEPLAYESEVDVVKKAAEDEATALREEIAAVEERALKAAADGDKALLENFQTQQTAAGEAFRKALDAGDSVQSAELARLRAFAEGTAKAAEEANLRSAKAAADAAAAKTTADNEATARTKAINDTLAEVRAGKIKPEDLANELAKRVGGKGGLGAEDIALLTGAVGALLGAVGVGKKVMGKGKPKGDGKPPASGTPT